ncbi:MAG TPA: hypothetical protein VK672_08405, partial [Solirubrobacteraceae bacterium]|nr:hypothetical protein [Solirubrobacteraceae bacterium]
MSEQQSPPVEPAGLLAPEPPSRGGADLRAMLASVALLLVAGASLLGAGCGSSQTSAGIVHQASSSKYSGSLASPPAPEPPLLLHNYRGEP